MQYYIAGVGLIVVALFLVRGYLYLEDTKNKEALKRERASLEQEVRSTYVALFNPDNYTYNEITKCLVYNPINEVVLRGKTVALSSFWLCLSKAEQEVIATFWHKLYDEMSLRPNNELLQKVRQPYISV